MLDEMSIFKGQSNISVSLALQTIDQPTNQPTDLLLEYSASPDFFRKDGIGNLEFSNCFQA